MTKNIEPLSVQTVTSVVPYLCPVEVDGKPIVLNLDRSYDVTAPVEVYPDEEFTVTFDSIPINPLPQFNKKVWDVKIVFKLPEDTGFVRHTLSGGSNLGDSTQMVKVEGDRVELYASGPFKAGEESDLPNLSVVLIAPQRGELVTAPGGTSYDDPGFRWTSEDPNNGQIGDLQCYPDPAKPVQFSKTIVKEYSSRIV